MLALFGGCVHLSAANSCCGVMVQGSPIRSSTMRFHQNISPATLNQSSLMDLLFHHACFQRVRFTLWTRANKPWPLAVSLPGTVSESLTWHVRTATCLSLILRWFFKFLQMFFFLDKIVFLCFVFFLFVPNLPAGMFQGISGGSAHVRVKTETVWTAWELSLYAVEVLRCASVGSGESTAAGRPAFPGEHVRS